MSVRLTLLFIVFPALVFVPNLVEVSAVSAQEAIVPDSSSDEAHALALLQSSDPSEIAEGLQSLGLFGHPGSAEAIEGRIRRGLPPRLLDMAIDTLTVLGPEGAGPVLFELLNHRRASVRQRVVTAIVATRAPGAGRALQLALRDLEPAVRSTAATGLGELRAVDAVDALFHAMERGVREAPMAIARMATPRDVEHLLENLGTLPFANLSPALSEMLHRSDLPESSRLQIVHAVAELATAGIREFLEDFASSAQGTRAAEAAMSAAARIAQ